MRSCNNTGSIMPVLDVFLFLMICTRSGVLFMSNCKRSLEPCSRKVTEYSELTELLWKHAKLMMRVVYDGGLV